MPFDMLFQGKKDAFIRNTANKYHIINAILTEPKKPGCNIYKNSKFLEMSQN